MDIRFDGFFSDIGFDGFLLYQKIRNTDSRIKICFLTATEYFYEQIRKEHGFGDFKQELFLRKPIEIEDLVHSTEKLSELGTQALGLLLY